MKRYAIWFLILSLVLIFTACTSGAPTKGDVIVYVAGRCLGSRRTRARLWPAASG